MVKDIIQLCLFFREMLIACIRKFSLFRFGNNYLIYILFFVGLILA